MTQEKQAPVLSIEWLRDQLMVLLAQAQIADPPDHQACAKYADLLYKMLPKNSNDKAGLGADELARARAAVREAMAQPPEKQ